jgi:hypothetical protein
MTRRAFLVIAGGLAVLAGGAIVARRVGAERLRRGWNHLEGFGRSPAAKLRRHYAWLNVEPDVFDRYVADYESQIRPVNRFWVQDPAFFTRCLLSTTFFVQPDQATPVRYRVFYEPATHPCINPIAGRPPSDAELARS